MQMLAGVICISLAIHSNFILRSVVSASENGQKEKELSTRSIDGNSKSSDQPLRVNLSCK